MKPELLEAAAAPEQAARRAPIEEVRPEWIMKMQSSESAERRKVIHFSDTGGQPVFEDMHSVFQTPFGSHCVLRRRRGAPPGCSSPPQIK